MNDNMSGWYRIVKSTSRVFGEYIYVEGPIFTVAEDLFSNVKIHQYRGWFINLKDETRKINQVLYIRDGDTYEKLSEDELLQVKSEYL